MTNYRSSAEFPLLTDVKVFIGGGQDVALMLNTTERPIHFRVRVGQIGMLVGKLFESGSAARRRAKERGSANVPNDIVPMAGVLNQKFTVATSVGEGSRGMIGIVTEIGGVPFTGMLSREDALILSDRIRVAVASQRPQINHRPN